MSGIKVGGTVTGISTETLTKLNAEKDELRAQSLDLLIKFYSAPSGDEGDALRNSVDAQIKSVVKKGVSILQQIDGIEDTRSDAQTYKDDLKMWWSIVKK